MTDRKDPWEMIYRYVTTDGSLIVTDERMPVPGGWIYRTLAGTNTGTITSSAVFVPFVQEHDDGARSRTKGISMSYPSEAEGRIPDFSKPAPRRRS